MRARSTWRLLSYNCVAAQPAELASTRAGLGINHLFQARIMHLWLGPGSGGPPLPCFPDMEALTPLNAPEVPQRRTENGTYRRESRVSLRCRERHVEGS